MEANPSLTMLQLVDQWAAYQVKALKTQIRKRNIGVSHKLAASLAYNIVRASDGNVQKAQIMFNFYGRFVDMGVGRGMPVGSRRELGSVFLRARNLKGQLHKYGRKPKKWYSKPMAAGFSELSEILGKHFAYVPLATVESELSKAKIEITF